MQRVERPSGFDWCHGALDVSILLACRCVIQDTEHIFAQHTQALLVHTSGTRRVNFCGVACPRLKRN